MPRISNHLTLIANVVTDPTLRYTPDRKPVLDLRLAVNRRVQDGAGWKDGDPTYYDLVLWEDAAENAAVSYKAGTRVIVDGELHTENWVGTDGIRRAKLVITNAEIGPTTRYATVSVLKNERVAAK